MELYFVYITTGSKDEALKIGKTLVSEKLAACINILDPMTSVYWWEGEIQEDRETVLIAKTTRRHLESLTEKVRQLHSYDCPCVASIPLGEAGNQDYYNWLRDSVKSR